MVLSTGNFEHARRNYRATDKNDTFFLFEISHKKFNQACCLSKILFHKKRPLNLIKRMPFAFCKVHLQYVIVYLRVVTRYGGLSAYD